MKQKPFLSEEHRKKGKRCAILKESEVLEQRKRRVLVIGTETEGGGRESMGCDLMEHAKGLRKPIHSDCRLKKKNCSRNLVEKKVELCHRRAPNHAFLRQKKRGVVTETGSEGIHRGEKQDLRLKGQYCADGTC